jgi:subtilisin family serine protease
MTTPKKPPPWRSRAIAAFGLAAPIATGLLAIQGSSAAVPADAAAGRGAGAFVPGELLVRLRPGPSQARADRTLAARGIELRERLPVPGLWRAQLPAGTPVREAASELERTAGIRYAEPNYYRYPHAIPDDPLFTEQWYLHNTGQPVGGTPGEPDADVDAPEAWDIETGSADVVVAVVDDGLAHPHSDLAPNLWTNPGETGAGRESNGIDDDANGYIDDWRGWSFLGDHNDPTGWPGVHGTWVAGVIGARGDDGAGIAGLNWDVSLMPLRIYFGAVADRAVAGGSPGEAATVARIVEAFRYAGANGADVVNASFGHPTFSRAERDAIAAVPGVLFAVSAGNRGRNIDAGGGNRDFPCGYRLANVICVAATDHRDRLSDFSSFGRESVDLAAPGEAVITTSVDYRSAKRLRESFDSGLRGWGRGGRRGRWGVARDRHGGDRRLADSPGAAYRNRANAWIRSPAFDLSGMRGCTIRFGLRLRSERGRDFLYVETSGDGAEWDVSGRFSGSWPPGVAWVSVPHRLQDDPSVYLRFRLRADRHGRREGASLDNLRIVCGAPGDGFLHVDGTSFSAPHVAGTAALLLADDPQATTTELRERILESTDPLPSLEHKVATGGRLNVAGALATGG